MAKQSGLHQIRGKVGEHLYYRQTGISSGLIRSINQGMSERVKTAEEYANTRLNNQEFGAACNVAALLGKCVSPKFRPMVLPFSQSKMAKDILKLARQNTEQWGQRTVSSSQTPQLAAVLSAQSKRDASEFVAISINRTQQSAAEVHVNYTAEQATLMASLGINHLSILCSLYNLATGQWNAITREMASGYVNRKDFVTPVDEIVVPGTGSNNEEDLQVADFIPEPNHAAHQLVVCVVLPSRVIDGTTHILQEYCSYAAFALPAYSA